MGALQLLTIIIKEILLFVWGNLLIFSSFFLHTPLLTPIVGYSTCSFLFYTATLLRAAGGLKGSG